MKLFVQLLLILFLLTACSSEQTQSAMENNKTPRTTLTITKTPIPTQTVTPSSTVTLIEGRSWSTVTAIAALAQNNELAAFLELKPSSTPSITLTPKPTATKGPSLTPSITPTISSETLRQSTLEAFGDPCEPHASKEKWGSGTSPDNAWIASACYERREGESSYLHVYNLDSGIEWRIYYKDYARNTEFQRRHMMDVFHWSQDGKYLYATSTTIRSGCCWIGSEILLVRLDLKTGRQVDIVNFIDDRFVMADFSISPSDRYLLYVPGNGDNILRILDLGTWKQREIKLKYANTGAGYIVMSNKGNKVVLVLREYPEEYQGDLTYGSLVVINLENGSQKKLLSGQEYGDTPRPVSWQDDDHVIVRDNENYWLLNIHTAELEVFNYP